MDEDSSINAQKRLQLLIIDKNQKVSVIQKCKIVVNKHTKKLIVSPENADSFTTTFNQNYRKCKNFLYICRMNGIVNVYVLIFPSEEKCEHVFNAMQNATEKLFKISSNILFNKFFLPIFNDLKFSNVGNPEMKKIGYVLIKFGFGKKQQRNFLNASNISVELFNKVFGLEDKKGKTIPRKRKLQIENALKHQSAVINKQEDATKINYEIFEVIDYEEHGKSKSKLIVFCSTQKVNCYEYYWDNKFKSYKCCGCKSKNKTIRAEVCKRNGKSYVKENGKQHVCEIRKFNREKYVLNESKQIVEAPNFELHSYEKKGISKKTLVIFFNAERKLCYEYIYEKLRNVYLCAGCNMLYKRIVANIQNYNGKDVVKLSALKHVCQPRIYNPEKFAFDPSKNILETFNFEIITFKENDAVKQRLLIFPSSEREFCYEYRRDGKKQTYFCRNCNLQGKRVKAQIYQKDGKDFAQLSSSSHVCQKSRYDPEKYTFSKKIIEASDFKIINYQKNGIPYKTLILFDPSNRQCCYEYYWSEKSKKFVCCGCLTDTVSARIKKDDNGMEYAELSKEEHTCMLREYNPEKYSIRKILKPPRYQILKRRYHEKIVQRLIVFDENESSMCYEYTWSKSHNYYICNTCQNKHKHFVSAHIVNSGKEDEYLEMNKSEHKCQLRKFVPEDLSLKVIKKPDFKTELYFGKDGEERKRIIIYKKGNKSLCYILLYKLANKNYQCHPCLFKKRCVSAKLQEDENGEEYLEVNGAEHICQPRKSETKIIELPNFVVEKLVENGVQKMSLIVYKNANKRMPYKFHYCSTSKLFFCTLCQKDGKIVTAQLKYKDNKESYLTVNSMKHICEKNTV